MRHEHITPVHRFERLSRLRDFEVGRDDIDPRGWPVVNVENHALGEVRDLIVDTDRMTARYLDVALEPKAFHLREANPRILVPMDRAHRVGDHKRLRIDGLTAESVAAMMAAREEDDVSFWDRWWDR